jgi:hypothetical protein
MIAVETRPVVSLHNVREHESVRVLVTAGRRCLLPRFM